MFDWIPRKLRYALGVLSVLSLAVPTGISHDSVIVGHTVFKNAAGYDQCLASIVGWARSQVLWFNDMVLLETDPKGQYLYAVRAGAKAPPIEGPQNYNPGFGSIYGDGVVYEFRDPNDHTWVVLEGYYYTKITPETSAPSLGQNLGDVSGGAKLNTSIEMVWIVQIGPTFRDGHAGNDAHEFYNFVSIIDTCKFGVSRSGNVTHAANDANHPPGEIRHDHDTYAIDLYIGNTPRFVPLGAGPIRPGVNSTTVGSVTV